MARNSPVAICRTRHTPSKDPKFHHDEMFDGAGRSMNEWLIIFSNGWFFRMLAIRFL